MPAARDTRNCRHFGSESRSGELIRPQANDSVSGGMDGGMAFPRFQHRFAAEGTSVRRTSGDR